MKPSLLVLLLTILIVSCKENKQQDTTIENQKEVVVDNTNEKEEVLKIMKSYKDAIQTSQLMVRLNSLHKMPPFLNKVK